MRNYISRTMNAGYDKVFFIRSNIVDAPIILSDTHSYNYFLEKCQSDQFAIIPDKKGEAA